MHLASLLIVQVANLSVVIAHRVKCHIGLQSIIPSILHYYRTFFPPHLKKKGQQKSIAEPHVENDLRASEKDNRQNNEAHDNSPGDGLGNAISFEE